MTQKLSLKDLSLKAKRVLMRVDFNVPIDKNGQIADDSRIKASLPSIQYVLNQGASLILMSHLGRPKAYCVRSGFEDSEGSQSGPSNLQNLAARSIKPDPQFSLAPCAKRLSELLKQPVAMAPDCIGAEVEKMAAQNRIVLLENLRFHAAEETPEKDPSFAAQLAKLGDCYVNDAFGTAHRAHASTTLIAKYFPGKAAMGFLMAKEVAELTPLLQNPKKPFYAIIGGAKISTKIGVIARLLECVDALFIGGGMTFTFLKAQGIPIGDSISEDPAALGKINWGKIHLPIDLVIADAFANDAKRKIILAKEGIPEGWQGMDIGPQTVAAWSKEFQTAATIFWNGPLGVFEMPHFALGTQQIADCLAKAKAKTIVGGGDSVAAIQQMGLASKFSHLSTGGGASLEFLEFGHLPGIDALSNK